ncbi:MAG: glycosyltransferase family 4 protein [Candidatus Aminicenantes bacterium]|nr:glycosyltransferase family 4 protein [Candidatus Aminicenantes bacterium]
MKTVLFVSHSSELNGAERMLLDVLRGLERGRFRPLLALPRKGPLQRETEEAGILTRVLPMKWSLTERSKAWKQPLTRAWNFPGVIRMARLIRNEAVDLVVTNTSAIWTGAFAARRAGVPHVWFVHEILDGEGPLLSHILGRKALVRRMDKLAVRIVANSGASARAFGGTGKAVVIGNGIDTGRRSIPDLAALRVSLGLDEGVPVLGIIGKIYPGKGQKETVLALDLLKRRRPDIRLLIVGEVKDGRFAGEVRETVRCLGLEKNVIFLGFREDLSGILALLDVLIVASTVDSLGRVGLEAMASGTPVVAVAAGGLPEVVIDGRTGVLVGSADPARIAEGAARVLDDPVLARAIAEGGRRFVEQNFSLKGQLRKIERVLEDCLES